MLASTPKASVCCALTQRRLCVGAAGITAWQRDHLGELIRRPVNHTWQHHAPITTHGNTTLLLPHMATPRPYYHRWQHHAPSKRRPTIMVWDVFSIPVPFVPAAVFSIPAPYVPGAVFSIPAPYVPGAVFSIPAPYVPGAGCKTRLESRIDIGSKYIYNVHLICTGHPTNVHHVFIYIYISPLKNYDLYRAPD